MFHQLSSLLGAFVLAFFPSAAASQDHPLGETGELVGVRLALSDATAVQYEPLYVDWSVDNRRGEPLRFSRPLTLEVERQDGASWVSPYSSESPQPRDAASPAVHPLPTNGGAAGAMEFVDLAVVGSPGKYRARAWIEVCEFEAPAPTQEAPWPLHAGLGLVSSAWIEFEVLANERNAAIFGEARGAGQVEFRRCTEILYARDYEAALFSRGKPSQLDSVLTTHETARRMLESGASPGLARKARLWLAVDQMNRGAHNFGVGAEAAARANYRAARSLLLEAEAPAGAPAAAVVVPAASALAVHCLRRLGEQAAADALLARLERDHPAYLAERPQAARVLTRNP